MGINFEDIANSSEANPEIIAQIKAAMDEGSQKTAQTKFDKFIENLTQTVKDFAKVNNTTFEEIASNVEKYADRIHAAYERAYGAWNKTTTGGVPITQAQAIQQVATAQGTPPPVPPSTINSINATADATRSANAQTNQWVGTVKEVAAGLGIYVSIASAVRAIVGVLKEAVQNAITFNQNLFTLQVGIRAMQRSGLDVTFKGMSDSIKAIREEFKVFSTQDIVQGYALATVKMRQLGASQQQLNTLMSEAGKLAILSGQNISDVAQDISYAITTGYSRTLKNLGIAFSRQMLDAEAAAMGIRGAYTSLDAQTKLLVAQSLIERQLKGYAADISGYYKTNVGQLEMAQASIKESSTTLGEIFVPIWANILTLVARAADFWATLFGKESSDEKVKSAYAIQGMLLNWRVDLLILIDLWNKFASKIPGGKLLQIDTSGMQERLRKYYDELNKQTKDIVTGISADAVTQAMEGLTDAEVEIVQTAFGALKDDYETAYADFQKKLLDIDEETKQKLLEAQENFNQKSIDLNTKYQQQLSDMALKHNQDLTDAYSDYQFDLESIQIDYQNSKADLQEKYNQESLNKEIELQRKLDELRDKAFFDLDEAIRTRDARKARSIIRQYNFDRAQAIKDADGSKIDRQAQFQRELADLARQANRRAEERQIDYQRKLEDLARQYAREQEMAVLNHERDVNELNRWLIQERNIILKNQQNEINDARRALQQKLRDLGESYVKEYGMNVKLAQALQTLWNSYYANNPINNASINSFTQGLSDYINRVNLPALVGGSASSALPTTGGLGASIGNVYSRSAMQAGIPTGYSSNLSGGAGKVEIQVSFVDGLVGKIVNASLQSLQNIIASVVNGGK